MGGDWPSIRKSIAASDFEIRDLRSLLLPRDGVLAEDASLVIFGSLARGEFSPHSDLDWILLVDGKVRDHHSQVLQTVHIRLRDAKKVGPSDGGIFGKIVQRQDIASSVRGQNDTKANLCYRMLLLLEPLSIGEDLPRQRTTRAILEAYLALDPARTLRPLLDDLVRFGRIMAVDFADADCDQPGAYWGLRNAKRRFSRKLILLTGMLACFTLQSRCVPKVEDRGDEGRIEYLEDYCSRPPLETLADELLKTDAPNLVRQNIFRAYDRFLGLLEDARSRNQLIDTTSANADKTPIFKFVQEIGNQFQEAIATCFFSPGKLLSEVIRGSSI